MVKTPVLFITFARPNYARQTFEAIKKAKPRKLYFYSNKGREEKEDEIERNNEIRSYVNEIDWDCELHTWFRDECVDVYSSIHGAIDWFFKNEEEGIILEEDCVPTIGFFSFVQQMLSKFKNDQRVWFISGDNYLNCNPCNEDYIFSRMCQIYGWASWRDRWFSMDWSLNFVKDLCKKENLSYLYPNKSQRKDRKWTIKKQYLFLKKTRCWDGIFYLNMEKNGALAIFPKTHLVTNVGLLGAHNNSKKSQLWNTMAIYDSSDYPIKIEPQLIIPNYQFDKLLYEKTWKKPSFFRMNYYRLRHLCKRLIVYFFT